VIHMRRPTAGREAAERRRALSAVAPRLRAPPVRRLPPLGCAARVRPARRAPRRPARLFPEPARTAAAGTSAAPQSCPSCSARDGTRACAAGPDELVRGVKELHQLHPESDGDARQRPSDQSSPQTVADIRRTTALLLRRDFQHHRSQRRTLPPSWALIRSACRNEGYAIATLVESRVARTASTSEIDTSPGTSIE
jgi:hypothetical protein